MEKISNFYSLLILAVKRTLKAIDKSDDKNKYNCQSYIVMV